MSDPKGMGLSWGVGGSRREMRRRRNFPTVQDLREGARRRIPAFAFEYADCGVGSDLNVRRNAQAFDAVEIVPRYGVDRDDITTAVTLFGRDYSAPFGIAPMGLPSMIWPGAEIALGHAAQKARIPYIAGCVGGCEIERLGVIAPDVLWFQLYRIPDGDHKVGFDLVRRAQRAGAHALVLTLDVPMRSKRPREIRNRLAVPFQPGLRTIYEVASSPAWLAALMRNGQPGFANLTAYVDASAGKGEVAEFVSRQMRGAFTWEEVARYRELWNGPLVVKGIMHPEDARKAIAVGVDGIQVSNHGGRQFEPAPAAIDVLPAIAQAAGDKATILFDSGIRSGVDVLRALALGAQTAFAGRVFLFALGAIGDEGAGYAVDMLCEEIHTAFRQAGIHDSAQARSLILRHPAALQF